ncbi:right-handed parallel beta-helix repeat-containing protein [candidate division KSB1 bacterium]
MRLDFRPLLRVSILFIAFSLNFVISTQAGNATVPGEVTTPYPTIINLAVEWMIEGDDNLNGVVTVRYRKPGDRAWKEAMPLRRVPAGKSVQTTPIFHWDNKHSGSIFNLHPDTEYEIQLKLTDPDGGSAERTVRTKTRPVPRAAPNSMVKAANPKNFKEIAATLAPGEILELTPGYYRPYEAAADGLPGKPIVIRSQGGSVFDSISLRDRKYVHLDGLTVWGSVELMGGEHLTVRRCTVRARYGIIAKNPPGAKNCYIADNVVTYKMPWVKIGMASGNIYGGPANLGEGIEITGPGNVICHNFVEGFRDCISTMEDRHTAEQVCIDIYNNDINRGPDDGVEADFCFHNCRIMRNRITNCNMGLSSQPGLGGPTYFIGNALYNITMAAFKLHRYSTGDVLLHNTVVRCGDGMSVRDPSRPWTHSLWRNNLCIGGIGGEINKYVDGDGQAIYLPMAGEGCDFDYDAVGTYLTPFRGVIGEVTFNSIEELRERTTEKHAVQVDLSVFNNVAFPYPSVPEWDAPDLRPVAGSAVIDAGVALPNINDGYKGSAPDIGAYELGDDLPHYGPRPAGMDEETMSY